MAGFRVKKLAGDRWRVYHKRLRAGVVRRGGEYLVWVEHQVVLWAQGIQDLEAALAKARDLLLSRDAAKRLGAS